MAETVRFHGGEQVTRAYSGNRRFRYEVHGYPIRNDADSRNIANAVVLYPSDADRVKLIELLGGTPKPCPETCACGCGQPCRHVLPDHYEAHGVAGDDHWMPAR